MNRIYWIPDLHLGSLGMMARPRGHDWLEEEIVKLKLQEVDIVVSLLERSESYELGLHMEAAYCREKGIEFINFPIPDRGTPNDKIYFLRFISQLESGLKQGSKIVVHCRMGIGRTSLVCASLLIRSGYEPVHAFDHLSQIRTLEVPDTSEQKAWVLTL